MRRAVLIFFMFAFMGVAQAQQIKWMTFDEALAAQQLDPKPIFMDVYTDWCGPCKVLDKKTFADAKVEAYISANYYAVKFNAESDSKITYKGITYGNPEFIKGRTGKNTQHEFAKFLKLIGYPTMFIFDAKGEVLKSLVGFKTAEQLLTEL